MGRNGNTLYGEFFDAEGSGLSDSGLMDFVEYVVQPGDTLWGISRRFYGTSTLYPKIEWENAETLSGYRYLIPGMALWISKED